MFQVLYSGSSWHGNLQQPKQRSPFSHRCLGGKKGYLWIQRNSEGKGSCFQVFSFSFCLWFLFSAEVSLEPTVWTLFRFNGQTLWLVRRLAPVKRSVYVFAQHRREWVSLMEETEKVWGLTTLLWIQVE